MLKEVVGVPTGLTELDEKLGGLHIRFSYDVAELLNGKTALALNKYITDEKNIER